MNEIQRLSEHDLLIRIDERTDRMEKDIVDCMAQQKKYDTRIRRIEMWFVPVLAVLSVIAHKIMSWLHL